MITLEGRGATHSFTAGPPPLLTVSRLPLPISGCPSWTTVFSTGRGVWSICQLLFHKRHILSLNLHLLITPFNLVPLLIPIKTQLQWCILFFSFSTSPASAIPSLYLAIDCSRLLLHLPLLSPLLFLSTLSLFLWNKSSVPHVNPTAGSCINAVLFHLSLTILAVKTKNQRNSDCHRGWLIYCTSTSTFSWSRIFLFHRLVDL